MYEWEKAFYPKEEKPLTMDECRALVARVWADYRPESRLPTVGASHAGGNHWEPWSRTIALGHWGRQTGVVLHETAHSLLDSTEWHGPKFAALLIDLFDRYAGADRVAMRKAGIEQRPRRVHFAKSAEVPQPKSRAYMKWHREHAVLVAARKAAEEVQAAHLALRPVG